MRALKCIASASAIVTVSIAALSPAASASQPAFGTRATASQLRTLVPKVAAAAGLSTRLVLWWQQGSVWRVGLSEVTNSARSALKNALGSDTVVTRHDPIRSAARVQRINNDVRTIHVKITKKATGNGARVVTANPPPPGNQTFPNRLLDGYPYSGGDRIYRTFTTGGATYIVQCTAATLSTLGMLSAGHCDGGTPNTVWQQGYLASDNNIYTTGTYGTSIKSVWATNKVDSAVLRPYNGFNSTIYLTTPTPFIYPPGFATDNGSTAVKVGSKICSDGSFSNEKCGGTVTHVNVCINAVGETFNGTSKTVHECGIDEATSSSDLVQAGDSGGAVLLSPATSGGRVMTVGINSAGSGAKDLFFSDVGKVNSTLGVSEVRG